MMKNDVCLNRNGYLIYLIILIPDVVELMPSSPSNSKVKIRWL